MSALKDSVPYSKAGLENLAVALGVDSAKIWINPTTGALDIFTSDSKSETSASSSENSALDENSD